MAGTASDSARQVATSRAGAVGLDSLLPRKSPNMSVFN
jgi:hypothetical protein